VSKLNLAKTRQNRYPEPEPDNYADSVKQQYSRILRIATNNIQFASKKFLQHKPGEMGWLLYISIQNIRHLEIDGLNKHMV
jgi:hypothetical protein